MSEEQKQGWLSPLDQKIIRLRGVIATQGYSCLGYISDKLAGKRYGGDDATSAKLSELQNLLNSIIWHPDTGTIVPFEEDGVLWIAIKGVREELNKTVAVVNQSIEATLKHEATSTGTDYKLTYGQAHDYAASTGGAVFDEGSNTRYRYDNELACLMDDGWKMPSHAMVMGRWRKEAPDHE